MEPSKLLAPAKKIFIGVLIYVAAGLIFSIVDPYIATFKETAERLEAVELDGSVAAFKEVAERLEAVGLDGSIPIFSRIINWLALTGLVCGFVFTFIGLKRFKEVSTEKEAKAIGQVCLSYIFLTIATLTAFVTDFIDVKYLNWAVGAFITLAPVFMVLGYNKLRKSTTYKANMKSGFRVLFIASIIMIVGEGVDLIPPDFIGSILKSICIVPAFLVTLIGWDKVKRAAVKA